MNRLNKKAFNGLLYLAITMAVFLFVPAGTINYWQAWVFLSVFFISSLTITAYLMKKDPKLLEKRVSGGPGSEKENSQKIIQILSSLAFLTLMVIPAIDHRLDLSVIPDYLIVSGDILVAAGFYVVFLVFRENSFTSSIFDIHIASWEIWLWQSSRSNSTGRCARSSRKNAREVKTTYP